MHTHQLTDRWSALTHGDFSGEVLLQYAGTDNQHIITAEIEVPMVVLQELVGRKLQHDLISAMENLSGVEFLNLKSV